MERYKPTPFQNAPVGAPSAVAREYGKYVNHPDAFPGSVQFTSPSVFEKSVQHNNFSPTEIVSDSLPLAQKLLLPESDPAHRQDNPPDTPPVLARMGEIYAFHEQRLKQLQSRLREPVSTELDTTVGVVSEDKPVDCVFPTTMGTLSFDELYALTRRYATSVLHYSYQMNSHDMDDGLQAGFLRLWQRLQKQPALLQDKAMAWIGKGIIYTALHATRGNWQFRQKTRMDGDQALESRAHIAKSGFRKHSHESRQTDICIDLHQAIAAEAEYSLKHEKSKQVDYSLLALYGLTMLQVSASEVSRLFGVRTQSMQVAYKRVRERLQQALPNYAPAHATIPFRQHGREALPRQDTVAICKANRTVSECTYEAVNNLIETTHADTRPQDELALLGIFQGIPARTQAQLYSISEWRMQRAYRRVYLMIGAQHDPQVRMLRPERRRKFVFTLTDENRAAVEQLALTLLQQPRSYEKLVALYAHICNQAISTTAKHFKVPTSTLRNYVHQFGNQLGTPSLPA